MKKVILIVFLIVGVYSKPLTTIESIPSELQLRCMKFLFCGVSDLEVLKKEFVKSLLVCKKWYRLLGNEFGASQQKDGAKILNIKSLQSFFSILKWHRNQSWRFPLHNALLRNDPNGNAMLKIASQEDLETRDVLGNFPLHYACHHGSETLVTEMLNKQKNLNGCNKLYEAIRWHDYDLATKLLDDGVNPNGAGNLLGITPLGAARLRPDKLKRSDEDTRIIQHLKKKKLEALTPLQEAAKIGATDVVVLLLKAGAYVDGIDERGRTALFYVLEKGPEDAEGTMQALIDHGASVTRKDTWNRSPFAITQEELKLKFKDMVKKSRGIDLSTLEKADITCSFVAQFNGLTL